MWQFEQSCLETDFSFNIHFYFRRQTSFGHDDRFDRNNFSLDPNSAWIRSHTHNPNWIFWIKVTNISLFRGFSVQSFFYCSSRQLFKKNTTHAISLVLFTGGKPTYERIDGRRFVQQHCQRLVTLLLHSDSPLHQTKFSRSRIHSHSWPYLALSAQSLMYGLLFERRSAAVCPAADLFCPWVSLNWRIHVFRFPGLFSSHRFPCCFSDSYPMFPSKVRTRPRAKVGSSIVGLHIKYHSLKNSRYCQRAEVCCQPFYFKKKHRKNRRIRPNRFQTLIDTARQKHHKGSLNKISCVFSFFPPQCLCWRWHAPAAH